MIKSTLLLPAGSERNSPHSMCRQLREQHELKTFFPLLHFLPSAGPEWQPAGARSPEVVKYGLVETDPSSEHLETFLHMSGLKRFSFDPLW